MSYLQLSGTPSYGRIGRPLAVSGFGRIGRPQAVGVDPQGVTLPWWLIIGGGLALAFGSGWWSAKKVRRSRNPLIKSARRIARRRDKILPQVFVFTVPGRSKPYRHRTLKAANATRERLRRSGITFTEDVINDPHEPGAR